MVRPESEIRLKTRRFMFSNVGCDVHKRTLYCWGSGGSVCKFKTYVEWKTCLYHIFIEVSLSCPSVEQSADKMPVSVLRSIFVGNCVSENRKVGLAFWQVQTRATTDCLLLQ